VFYKIAWVWSHPHLFVNVDKKQPFCKIPLYLCVHTQAHARTHTYIGASVTKGMFAATKRYYPLVCQNRYLRTISSMVQPFFSMSFIR
jgi:hypothetical protein